MGIDLEGLGEFAYPVHKITSLPTEPDPGMG